MSILRTPMSFDASMVPLQLRKVATGDSAVPPGASSASFQAQLLQQLMGILDRSSMSLNEPEAGASPQPMAWRRPQAMVQNHKPDPTAAMHPVVHQSPLGVQARERSHAASHTQDLLPSRQAQGAAAPAAAAPASLSEVKVALPVSPRPTAAAPAASAAEGFLGKLAGIAQTTASALGLSPHLLLAHAALESGWGRKAIKDAAGQESYNLFGIKADRHWTGKTVAVKTTEYVQGVPQSKVESFRAYDSYADSFADYARLIKHRYGEAMADGATAEGFGQALQAKGYATDPNYAQKIARVAQSVAYRLASRLTGTSALG
jgi:flagellar protein FlgJ